MAWGGCGIGALQATTAYKYVVLQATKDSLGFYERLGFVRVGAVARYNYRKSGSGGKGEIVGYRHWLGTDDSIERSDRASYMMACRLSPTKKVPHCNCSAKPKGSAAMGECLACAFCHKLFHRACIPSRSRVGNLDSWECPTCQINRAADLAAELQATQQQVLFQDQEVSASGGVAPRAKGGRAAATAAAARIEEEAEEEAEEAEEEEEEEEEEVEEYKAKAATRGKAEKGVKAAAAAKRGMQIMSRWGWVEHQPGCPCRCCKRQRVKLVKSCGGQTTRNTTSA